MKLMENFTKPHNI